MACKADYDKRVVYGGGMDEALQNIADLVQRNASLIHLTQERDLLIDTAIEIVARQHPELDVAAFRAACEPPVKS